jgi:hypothetical protein
MTKQEAIQVINQLEQRPFSYVLRFDSVDHEAEIETGGLEAADLRILLNLIDVRNLTLKIEGGKLVIW